jgi:hypothetical protein
MKHQHYECIVAWAEGKQCEWSSKSNEQWNPITCLSDFDYFTIVRIKPEPKLDIVRYIFATTHDSNYNASTAKWDSDNLKLTFDGETSKLKSAEVI